MQLIDCYAALNDYESARQWLDKVASEKKEWTNQVDLSLISVQHQLADGKLDEARSTWQERGASLGPKLLWGTTDCYDYLDAKCLDAALQKDENGRR